jgi:hypothetical protein
MTLPRRMVPIVLVAAAAIGVWLGHQLFALFAGA